jgi:hypothetical protein
MPLLFRRAGCRISAPSGLFSPGRSRMPRMFRMHARAKPLLCRGNRRVRRLSNRAGCITFDTLCQNEHTSDPVRTVSGLRPFAPLPCAWCDHPFPVSLFSRFRSPDPRYGLLPDLRLLFLARPPCLCSAPRQLLEKLSRQFDGANLLESQSPARIRPERTRPGTTFLLRDGFKSSLLPDGSHLHGGGKNEAAGAADARLRPGLQAKGPEMLIQGPSYA